MSLNPSVLLPSHIAIRGADSQLYSIGLSLFETKSVTRRTHYNHPAFVLSVLVLHLIRNLILINCVLSFKWHLYLGDIDYFINTGCCVSLISVLSNVLCIGSQLIHFHNYKCRRWPTYLRMFEMAAGMVTPANVGLRDGRQIKFIVAACGRSLKINKLVNSGIGYSTLVLGTLILSSRATWLQTILISVPQAVTWAVWVNKVYSILNTQSVYFYLLTLYLKMKLKNLNSKILLTKSANQTDAINMIRELSKVFKEIADFNDNLWSKFLFLVWTTISALISLLMFVVLIVGVEQLIIKILFVNYVLIDSTLLLFLISICSQIYSETETTHHLLLNYLCLNDKMKVVVKLEVNFNRD